MPCDGIYFTLYGLFFDGVSVSDYIVHNGGRLVSNEFGKDLEGSSHELIKILS
jgi:hypothetical protein